MNKELNLVLFDRDESYENLLPLSYTRPVAAFRVGIVTIAEKWKYLLGIEECSYLPQEYLREKFPMHCAPTDEALYVSGDIIPNAEIADAVMALAPGEALHAEHGVWAYRGTFEGLTQQLPENGKLFEVKDRRIQYVFDVFRMNALAIVEDYDRLVQGEGNAPDPSVTIIGNLTDENGKPRLYIEEGACVEGCTINLKEGPVYIGRDAAIMEGCCVRGPLALCDKAKIKMGAKVYEGCTFGPYCKVGGELQNVVMFGYSNKAHDGYLGNAVVGEWCNIGAGTNASNLKNDYAKIRIWNYRQQRFMRTDLQFCGLIMGDHSKAGVNCMFNTATVVGVGVNLHGAGFPRVFIPSFSAGSPEAGFDNVSIDTFMTVAQRVMGRRDLTLTDVDRRIFEVIYANASRFKGR